MVFPGSCYKDNLSSKTVVQGPQLNTPTAVNHCIPARDTTPKAQAADKSSPPLEQEPESCQRERSDESFTVVSPEPEIKVRPRTRRQRLPPEM